MTRPSWRFWDTLANVALGCVALGCLGIVAGFLAARETGRMTEVYAWATGGSAALAFLALLGSLWADAKATQARLRDDDGGPDHPLPA